MSLQSELHQIAGDLDGTLGLAVRVLRSGDEYRINDQELFPMASVFKVPLLVQLFRRIEEGALTLDDRVELRAEHQSPGSGVLKEFRPGATVTVWDLAVLMMIVSDNTATDILYEKVGGGEAISATMRELGLNSITVPYDCKGLLNAAAGLDPADRRPETLSETKRRLRSGEVAVDSPALASTPENNCATPADMMEIFTRMEQRTLFSAAACDGMIDILLRQQLNQRIPLMLPQPFKVAHKTGTVYDVRNDSGIIYLPNGDPIIFCAFTKGVHPTRWQEGDNAIARAALAVYNHYAAQGE